MNMKAIENNQAYQNYANTFVRDIPQSELKYIVNLMAREGSKIMGNDFNDDTLDSTIEMILTNHGRLPLSYVSSAIYRGAMGDFGSGRLVARTINQWLREVSKEYRRLIDHKEVQDRLSNEGEAVDLKKYPMGSAINKKIEWLLNGFISSEIYDQIDIKELSVMIRNNRNLSFEDYLAQAEL